MYASFPGDLEQQLRQTRAFSDKLACEASVERIRLPINRGPEDLDRLDRAFATVRSYTEVNHDTQTRVRANRVLASLALRLWDIRERTKMQNPLRSFDGMTPKHDFVTGYRPVSTLNHEELLELARNAYAAAYFLDGSRWELWIQVIVLCWALGADKATPGFKDDLEASRYLAKQLADRARKAPAAACEGALAAALAFEVELLAYLAGHEQLKARGEEDLTVTMNELFEQFLEAVSPVSESYRAYAAYRQLSRYQCWAVEREVDPPRSQIVRTYRARLEAHGVRRFWGPRT